MQSQKFWYFYIFPKHFYRDMTRKMNVLSVTGPRQIREDGDYFKYLKLEQAIERAHHELNELEKQFECVKNKPEKYFLMIKSYKNRQKIDQDIINTRHPFTFKSKKKL